MYTYAEGNFRWGYGETSSDLEPDTHMYINGSKYAVVEYTNPKPKWAEEKDPFKGETKSLVITDGWRDLTVETSSEEVLTMFLLQLEEEGIFWFEEDQLCLWNGEGIDRPDHASLSVEERKHYGVALPIKKVPLPEEVVEVLKCSFSVEKWMNKENDAFRNYGKGQTDSLIRAFQDGNVSAWEQNGDKFLYLEGEYRKKVCLAVNLGYLNLSGWYLADTNFLYKEEFEKWLEENNLKPDGKGVGVQKKMYFQLKY